MKAKWKFGIAILVLFPILAILYLSWRVTPPNASPTSPGLPDVSPPTSPGLPDVSPPTSPPITSPLPLPLPNQVDRLLDKMEFGAIVFNAPTNINIDDTPQIQLILSLAETIDRLKQSITEEGEKVGATIKVSDRMEARLSGYDFQITAITPEIQAVSKSQRTEWKWEIHAKEEGKHTLHLTLTALLEIDGHTTPRAIRTFDTIIEINVTTAQKLGLFFTKNWQWLWAVFIGPLFLGTWHWVRKRRKRKRERPAPVIWTPDQSFERKE